MRITYLVCASETRLNVNEGTIGCDVDWDRAKRPSECEWIVPGTEGDGWRLVRNPAYGTRKWTEE